MKSKKTIRIIAVLLVLAAAACFAYSRLGNTAPDAGYDKVTARTEDIETYYTFSGNIEPGDAQVVYANTRGTIRTVYKLEGDAAVVDEYILRPKNGDRILAPIDGTVTDIYVEEDDDFTVGDALFRIADYANPQLRIKVDEYDVAAITEGMAVEVRVHATGAKLDGTISKVAKEATIGNNIAYYEAIVEVPQDGTLRMGMTCEVVVERESARNATTLPIDVIQYDSNGKPFVYCYGRGDEVVVQTVLLGINDGTLVEIKDGVRSGETVLVPVSSKLPFAFMMGR